MEMREQMKIALSTIAIMIVSSATPVLAQSNSQTEAKVKVGDLNLRTDAGKETLETRVKSAANANCTSNTRDLAGKEAEARCRAEMQQNGALKGRMVAAEQNRAARLEAERLAAAHPHKAVVAKRHAIHKRHVTTVHHKVPPKK
jgi:UrcA family protein